MTNKSIDVAAIGELLIDFTEAGVSKDGMRLFEQNPGGAPANFLTAVSHFGYRTEFIGKIGKDMHGVFLKGVFENENIGISNLVEDENCFTTLAFVAINDGEREFSFARKPGADTQLRKEELDMGIISSCRVFHFGSLSLTDMPAREATVEAVRAAKAEGAIISYDPNYRKPLWNCAEEAVCGMKSVLQYADMLKVSDEEAVLLTGITDVRDAVRALSETGPKLVAVTLGSEGVLVSVNGFEVRTQAFKVKAVDTTGAGDAFWGGFVSAFLESGKSLESLTEEDIGHFSTIGNAAAALCVTKRGGIPAIPYRRDVEKFIAENR